MGQRCDNAHLMAEGRQKKRVQKKKRRRDLKREGPTIPFKGTPSVAKGDLLRGPTS